MKAFRFVLQPVLKVRELQERHSLAQLTRALAILRQGERRLADLEQERAQAEAQMRMRLRGEVPVAELAPLTVCLNLLNDSIQKQSDLVAQLEARRQECLDTYRSHRKKREVLEKLKAKAWRSFLYDLEREQQAEGDELAIRSAMCNG